MTAQKPLRIIHCFRSPIGGIFRHVRDLALEHSRAGHQVGIVCDSVTGGSFEDSLFDEIRPHLALGLTRIPIDRSIKPSDVLTFWKSYKNIKSLKPNVVHGHGAKGGAIARVIGSLLRVNGYCVARLYSPHGGSLHFGPTVAGRGIFLIERLLERFGDATVFVCEFERESYRLKVGKPNKRSAVIYNGIDESDFIQLDMAPDPKDFQYIGMLRDMKGADLFIRGFAEAERIVGRPMTAIMIGDGPDQEKYRRMMVELGLGRRITMIPAKPPKEAFQLVNTVVVPSRAEAMPYIVLEAIAAGKPLIASRVGGIPEVLGVDSPALVEPGDWRALGKIMAETITDKQWQEHARPDMARFRSTFSKQTMGAQMLELYRDILADCA